MANSYKHPSFAKCLGTQYFINRPVYAIDVTQQGGAETYALYSKRQYGKLKHKPVVDHIDRIEHDNLIKVFRRAVREYFWGWKLQLADEDECGCRVWRGVRVGIYCSAEHMMERFIGPAKTHEEKI